MEHCFIIEKFGKIERAKIQAAPITLFVGDNNSGKSYLLSLLWGIYSADEWSILFEGLEKLEQRIYREIYEEITGLVLNLEENQKQGIEISSEKFLRLLNDALERNKEKFVAEIFNTKRVPIQRLSVEIGKFDLFVESWEERGYINVSYNSGRNRLAFPAEMVENKIQFVGSAICRHILLWLLKGKRGYCDKSNVVYFPAARTGFMLAKNIINKVGRQKTFDVSEIFDEKREEELEPFTKPIIRFLDALEDLSLEHKTEYGEIVAWIEEKMAHGKIQYNNETSNEIRYVPEESEISLPLRTSSAVVTELTPLLLLLKYKRRLKAICYEEPEMCLHPQLQQEMGRLLIRLVNSGISIIATTHSDIIIQHINNMCKISGMDAPEELMDNLGLIQEDVINIQNVAVYQFTDRGTHSVVDRTLPENGEFNVETFANALMKILAQTSEVQDFEGE